MNIIFSPWKPTLPRKCAILLLMLSFSCFFCTKPIISPLYLHDLSIDIPLLYKKQPLKVDHICTTLIVSCRIIFVRILLVFVLFHIWCWCIMFCISVFVLLSFFRLAIVLSILSRFTTSDYPFGIFRLFLSQFNVVVVFIVLM